MNKRFSPPINLIRLFNLQGRLLSPVRFSFWSGTKNIILKDDVFENTVPTTGT